MTCSPYSPNDYKSDLKPVWCPGCGIPAVHLVYRALADLQREYETVVVSGNRMLVASSGYVETYDSTSLHGRARSLPPASSWRASGISPCSAVGGDGDGIAIGGNHMYAARRNVDIAYLAMDNEIRADERPGSANDAVGRQDEVDRQAGRQP